MNEQTRQIATLLQQGRKIEAIKLLRETTGIDLKEAKEEIDRLMAEMEAGGMAVIPERASLLGSSEVHDLARQGKKIEAIKLLREETGLSLKEAKARVEALPGGNTRAGCMAVAVGLALLIMGAVLFLFFLGSG